MSDITSTVYNNGTITIPTVTGNVKINIQTSSISNDCSNLIIQSRTTGNGINIQNNHALIDNIKGNTLVWHNYRTQDNCVITAYNASDPSGNNKLGYYKLTIEDNGDTIIFSDLTSATDNHLYFQYYIKKSRTEGHRYYCSANIYVDTDTTQTYARYGFGWTSANTSLSGSNNGTAQYKNRWNFYHNITYPVGASQVYFKFASEDLKSGTEHWVTPNTRIIIKNLRFIDLTAMFGAGYEPTMAEFEAMFPPDQYYSYTSTTRINAKKLIYKANHIEEPNNSVLTNREINLDQITGKYKGIMDSEVIFPNGMKSINPVYTSKMDSLGYSSGGSGITTDYAPTGDDIVIEYKFKIISYPNSDASNNAVFITKSDSGYTKFGLQRINKTNNYNLFNNSSVGTQISLSLNQDHEIISRYGSATIDGVDIVCDTTTGTANTTNLTILPSGCFINATFYYLRIYKAGVLVFDGIPVRLNNTAMVHDNISNKNFRKLTGTTTCGNDIGEPNDFIYDEIKKDEKGRWIAIKRVSDTAINTWEITHRNEYEKLDKEKIYYIDDEYSNDFDVLVENQGTEEINYPYEPYPTPQYSLPRFSIRYGATQ